jgi:hypothetical protein
VAALADYSPFGKNGGGDSRFAPGSEVFPFAGGLLGSDYNHRDHAVVTGSSMGGFLATFRGNAGRSSPRWDRVELFCANSSCIRHLRVCAGATLCGPPHGPKRVSLWRRHAGDCAATATRSPWFAAFHRSAEVSIGIGVALMFAVVWPEKEEIPLEGMPYSSLPKPGSEDIQVRT